MEILIIITIIVFLLLLLIFTLFSINENRYKDNIKIIRNKLEDLDKKQHKYDLERKKDKKDKKDKNDEIKEKIKKEDQEEIIDNTFKKNTENTENNQVENNNYNIYISKNETDITEEPYHKDIEKIDFRIKELNNNIESTQRHINDNFLINKNAKIYNDMRLCNNNDDCLLMNIDDNGDYNIKSENLKSIKLLNSDNRILGKISNDGIYFGGDNKDNSPLYINDNIVNAKIMKIGNLLINNTDDNNMIDVNNYVKSNTNDIDKLKNDYDNENDKRRQNIEEINKKILDIESDIDDNITKFSNLNNKSNQNITDIVILQDVQSKMIEDDRYFRRYSYIYEDLTDIPSYSEEISKNKNDIYKNKQKIDDLSN